MSDSEDALHRAITQMMHKHDPGRTIIKRPSGTAMGGGFGGGVHPNYHYGYTGILSRQRAGLVSSRHWIVTLRLQATERATVACLMTWLIDPIRERYNDETSIIEDCESRVWHMQFPVRRVASSATAALVEANDSVFELLHRKSELDRPMTDCAVISATVETTADYVERQNKEKELIEFQKNEIANLRFPSWEQGSKWDASGFDIAGT